MIESDSDRVSSENAHNPKIYDYLNVQYTHNATFYKTFPETLLQQARHFANIHEQSIFTDRVQNGVGESGWFGGVIP